MLHSLTIAQRWQIVAKLLRDIETISSECSLQVTAIRKQIDEIRNQTLDIPSELQRQLDPEFDDEKSNFSVMHMESFPIDDFEDMLDDIDDTSPAIPKHQHSGSRLSIIPHDRLPPSTFRYNFFAIRHLCLIFTTCNWTCI